MARSLLAFWLGGASSPPGAPATQGGFRSLLAFWAGGATSGASAPPPTTVEFYSGGWEHHPWLRRRKQYVEEQEIPQDVEEAIVASVARVSEVRAVRASHAAHAAAERALRAFLSEQKQAWKELYAQLIRLEYERREQEYEDAQIALMLFDM